MEVITRNTDKKKDKTKYIGKLRLKDIREDHDDKQAELANILGVKRGTYASWECGHDLIPTRKLYEFANYYEVSMDYILNLSKKFEKINKKNFDLIAISTRLKNIRLNTKLSQRKFAESLNINQSTWWGYENGKTVITLWTLLTLATTYNLRVDWILCKINK